jgi:hypothetical protein
MTMAYYSRMTGKYEAAGAGDGPLVLLRLKRWINRLKADFCSQRGSDGQH